MKTFNQLTAGDKLWYGYKEHDFQKIEKIDDTKDGRIFSFSYNDETETPLSNRTMIPAQKINKAEYMSSHLCGRMIFSCRQAAIDYEIKKHRHTIHCIKGEIDLKRKLIQKHETKIIELEKMKET